MLYKKPAYNDLSLELYTPFDFQLKTYQLRTYNNMSFFNSNTSSADCFEIRHYL